MSGGCDRERTDEERTIDGLRRDLAERTAERDEWKAQASANAHGCEEQKTFREAAEAERDALAATVERLIREAGAVRLDERQRAKAEHDSLADQGRQRCERRCEELEDTIARMRRIIDDADRVKDENETLRRDLTSTRAELKALHDVLSGAKKL